MPRKQMKINLPDLAHNHKVMEFQNSLSELKSNQKLLSAIKESSINIHESNTREENSAPSMNTHAARVFH